MDINLFDSELKIMEILWKEGDLTADQIGWSRTTTSTVLKKCVEKGAIERMEPNFICHPLSMWQQVQQYETRELIGMYDGVPDRLMTALLDSQTLFREEIDRLKQLILNLK